MRLFDSPHKNAGYLAYRWISPIFDPIKFYHALKGYFWFTRDYFKFRSMGTDMPLRFRDSYPILTDKVDVAPFDSHYFYMNTWMFRRIAQSEHSAHVDVASGLDVVSLLSTLKKVTFVDIRPIIVDLPNFECVKGSILDMPYSTDSIPSLSCLHVTEHIGLGRYGDPIDPQGSLKATQELKRVLAPGGSLFFSLPIGKPRICFNAHRVHSASQILQYFDGLELVDHACITDQITVIEKPDIAFMDSMTFGCGMFHFRKPLPA